MAKIKLSVVIPCYNEQERFQEGFYHYYSYLKNQKYSWELIMVNDGSLDITLKLMQRATKGKNNIKIVTYKTNHGKGYAIVQGVKKAKGEIILFTDIDHSVAINTVESFFRYFDEGFSVVIGSRRVPGSKILIRQNPLRELMGRGFTLLVNLLIWGVYDATCGFKAFKNPDAQIIFSKITVFDWAFDAEILFICKKLKFKFAQAPVKWENVKGTKVTLSKDILNSFFGLCKIYTNALKGIYN